VGKPVVWNSYAAPLMFIAMKLVSPFCERARNAGDVMQDPSEKNDASPYSAPRCILMLLGTGLAAKIGAAIHVCHLGRDLALLEPFRF
jgi:hypothetical protein